MTDAVIAAEKPAATAKENTAAVKESTQGNAKQRNSPVAPRRRISNPTIKREVELSTPQAQLVYRRTMGYVSGALFNLGVIMHVVGDSDDAFATEKIVSDAIEKARTELKAGLERSKILIKNAESAGRKIEFPDYSQDETSESYVQTPLAFRYLELIQLLDEVVKHVDALWLAGLVPSHERTDHNAQWQRSLMRLSNQILTVQKRAYSSAVKKGKKDELDKQQISSVTKVVNESDHDDAVETKTDIKEAVV